MVIRAAWGLATLLGLATPVLAGDCRLALVLALDVSSSVDLREDQLQRWGLAYALRDPEVERAFFAGDPVALYVFEWSDPSAQTALLPSWQLIRGHEDLTQVAEEITRTRRGHVHYSGTVTALGAALAHAAEVLKNAPDCRAWTVDVSGDGINNAGPQPSVTYGSHPFQRITVNGLVIGLADGEIDLAGWFRSEVLHGPEAFLVQAETYEDYKHAMTVKLLRELQLPVVGEWLRPRTGGTVEQGG